MDIMAELEQFREANQTKDAIVSLIFNDIKVEQSLELSNLQLRNMFPDSFQLLPKRRTFADRSFMHNLDAQQFDRLDQIFIEYIREKYAENPAQAEQIAQKAAHYFHQHQ